jgi:hypothetical protein
VGGTEQHIAGAVSSSGGGKRRRRQAAAAASGGGGKRRRRVDRGDRPPRVFLGTDSAKSDFLQLKISSNMKQGVEGNGFAEGVTSRVEWRSVMEPVEHVEAYFQLL